MTTDDPGPCKAAPHFIGQCDDFEAEPRWCCPLPAAAAERVAADLAAARGDYRDRPHPEGGYIIRLAYFTDFDRLEIAFMPKAGFTDLTGLELTHGIAEPERPGWADTAPSAPANVYTERFRDRGFDALAPVLEAERGRVVAILAEALGVEPDVIVAPPIDPAFTLEELGAPVRTVLNTEEQQRLEAAGINLDVYAVRFRDYPGPSFEAERARVFRAMGIDTDDPQTRALLAAVEADGLDYHTAAKTAAERAAAYAEHMRPLIDAFREGVPLASMLTPAELERLEAAGVDTDNLKFVYGTEPTD